jgi:HEAT repeat protein
VFRALSMLNDPACVPHVIDYFKRSDPFVRFYVMDCIASFGENSISDVITILIDSERDWQLRLHCAMILSEMDSAMVVYHLKDSLLRMSDTRRRELISLFDEIEASDITGPLSEFLRMDIKTQTPFQLDSRFSEDERRKNEKTLRNLLTSLNCYDLDMASNITFILSNFQGEEQIKEIYNILSHQDDSKIIAILIQIMGLIENNASIPYLKKFLTHHDRRVRSNVVEALARTRDNRVIQYIYPLTQDSDNRVKANAAKAIWEFGGLRAVEVLVQMLKNPDPMLRASGAYALGEIGSIHVVEPLLGALEDKSPEVKKNIAIALGKTEDHLALAPLKGLIFSHSESYEVRSEALKAVIKIDADQGREIKEILKNDNRVSGDLSKILDSI